MAQPRFYQKVQREPRSFTFTFSLKTLLPKVDDLNRMTNETETKILLSSLFNEITSRAVEEAYKSSQKTLTKTKKQKIYEEETLVERCNSKPA